MERRRIIPVLFAVLVAAALFLGVYFIVMYRNIYYLPEEALEDLCGILEKDGIYVDGEIIPLKRETGTIYVCDSEEYNAKVALQLGESNIKYQFATPDGELILLHNDAQCEFSSGFSFRYLADRAVSYTDGTFDASETSTLRLLPLGETAAVRETVREFLERGSSGFDRRDQLDIVTEFKNVYERDGIYYVECVRTIDDLEIAGNRVICVVDDGIVAEAFGAWCFLTLGKSYSAQLTDVFNILFSVKKEIGRISETEGRQETRIEAVEQCYTLHYLGNDGGFCFIPCWQIVTDMYGEFIFNAVDGTLYTNYR